MAPKLQKIFSERLSQLVLLALLTLICFGDLLFSGQRVISNIEHDLWSQFYHWRYFGFSELAKGNLPMWNPHLFSGAPYMANTQSALFYPLNLLFLILPNALAINWSVAIHSWLGGALTLLWLRHKKLHPYAALFGAAIMMFSAPYFLHIYAGHLSNISTMVWFPLILLGLDRWLDDNDHHGLMLGAIAVAMQVFAGHPQYLYYSGIAVSLYTLSRILLDHIHFRAAAIGMSAIYIIGVALSAIQFLPALEASTETIRASGVSEAFAGLFSLPPENILTLISPNLFGDDLTLPYWGRGFIWEMNLYIGIITLALALFALGKAKLPINKIAILCTVPLFILALGKHTPLFTILYHYLPGFDLFRGSSKFSYFASFFLITLACSAADSLVTGKASTRRFSYLLIAMGTALSIILVWLHTAGDNHSWQYVLEYIASTNESYQTPGEHKQAEFINNTLLNTEKAILFSSLLLIGVGLLTHFKAKSPPIIQLVLLLAAAEIALSSLHYRSSFDPRERQQVPFYRVNTSSPQSTDRILNTLMPNAALSTGEYNLWGYDPGILHRYAELIAVSLGLSQHDAGQYLRFDRQPEIFQLLRLAKSLQLENGKLYTISFNHVMKRANLIYKVEEFSDSKARLERLTSQGFDYHNIALTEQPLPFPLGKPHADDRVSITDSSTDHMTIDAKLGSPALLLITDSYSRGWSAYGLDDSAQRKYAVLPADHALIGIPLKKGHHHLRLEYRPHSFYLGMLITLFTMLGMLYFWQRSKRKPATTIA